MISAQQLTCAPPQTFPAERSPGCHPAPQWTPHQPEGQWTGGGSADLQGDGTAWPDVQGVMQMRVAWTWASILPCSVKDLSHLQGWPPSGKRCRLASSGNLEATLESCTGVAGSLGPSRNDDLTSNGGLHGAACRVVHKEDALVLPQGLQPAGGGEHNRLRPGHLWQGDTSPAGWL